MPKRNYLLIVFLMPLLLWGKPARVEGHEKYSHENISKPRVSPKKPEKVFAPFRDISW